MVQSARHYIYLSLPLRGSTYNITTKIQFQGPGVHWNTTRKSIHGVKRERAASLVALRIPVLALQLRLALAQQCFHSLSVSITGNEKVNFIHGPVVLYL